MKFVHKIILIIMSLLVLGIVAITLQQAGHYYLTPQIERPHLGSFHKMWKPGGTYGHGLGLVGSLMMIIMFSYSLRKRVRFFRKWGKLPTWLNYHIFLGITGPILVTLHTSFKFGGLVSVSYWSMVAVALSGFIGRYIYIKIPRRVSGREMSMKEFESEQHKMTAHLVEKYHLSEEQLNLIEKMAGVEKIKKRGMLGFFTVLSLDIIGQLKQRKVTRRIMDSTHIPRGQIRGFRKALHKRVKIARQIAFWNAAHQLFHYWHVIHKPFAYTMIVIMIIHVIVAVTLGFTWLV